MDSQTDWQQRHSRPKKHQKVKKHAYVPVGTKPQRSSPQRPTPSSSGQGKNGYSNQHKHNNYGAKQKRRRGGRPHQYVQQGRGSAIPPPYPTIPTTFHNGKAIPPSQGPSPARQVPPGLGYPPHIQSYRTQQPTPLAYRRVYHGDDSRYVASNNCIAFQRGNCTKGDRCEWRHFDPTTQKVQDTYYDPQSGGPGFQARAQLRFGVPKIDGPAARIGEKRHVDLDAASELLVKSSAIRTVSENDPTCWDYNSLRGCNRAPCTYVHKFVPYKFIHPYTGAVVDPQDAKRALMERQAVLLGGRPRDATIGRALPRSPPRGQPMPEEYGADGFTTVA